MRDFTPEEKELIINTPITKECFEMDDFEPYLEPSMNQLIIVSFWENDLIPYLETLRQKYNETKDELYFIELVRLLPNSYKVVKL